MKNVIFSIILSFAFSAIAVADDEKPITWTVNVPAFNEISIELPCNVHLTNEPIGTVRVVALEKHKDKIKVEVDDGCLTIESSGKFQFKKIEVYVNASNVSKLSISSASICDAEMAMSSGNFELEVSGASIANMGKVSAKNFSLDVSGASKASFTSVTCETIDWETSGASKAKVGTLTVGSADIEVSGASKISVNMTCETLEVEASGASNASLSGSAQDANISASSASKVNATSLSCQKVNTEVSTVSKITMK